MVASAGRVTRMMLKLIEAWLLCNAAFAAFMIVRRLEHLTLKEFLEKADGALERERMRLERDLAQVRSLVASMKRPWWRRLAG